MAIHPFIYFFGNLPHKNIYVNKNSSPPPRHPLYGVFEAGPTRLYDDLGTATANSSVNLGINCVALVEGVVPQKNVGNGQIT